MRHVPEDGEYGEASEDAGPTVCDAHYDGVFVAVIMKFVIGGQCCQTTPGNRQGEKYLSCCILPDLCKNESNLR